MYISKRTKWIWLTTILSIFSIIAILFYQIVEKKLFETHWINKFNAMEKYVNVEYKYNPVEITLKMKKWLNDPANANHKYYRVVVKGYGSYAKMINGTGIERYGVKHFYVRDDQYKINEYRTTIELRTGEIFCGNW